MTDYRPDWMHDDPEPSADDEWLDRWLDDIEGVRRLPECRGARFRLRCFWEFRAMALAVECDVGREELGA